MEHPPKQGLKPKENLLDLQKKIVLMEHPPKQGLKPKQNLLGFAKENLCFNGTSTKTRIETQWLQGKPSKSQGF